MSYSPLPAGQLDKRVMIQSETSVDDGGGGSTKTWVTVATVSASVDPGTGREFYNAKQNTPELSHVITMRYRAVSPKQKIIYPAKGILRSFNIHSVVDPGERNEQISVYCSEIVKT